MRDEIFNPARSILAHIRLDDYVRVAPSTSVHPLFDHCLKSTVSTVESCTLASNEILLYSLPLQVTSASAGFIKENCHLHRQTE